jgi:hypothetical protein
MPAYYFDMEGYKIGEKADPAVDKLISIQYQKMDLTTGEPLGELKILKEWESSEQAIVTAFYNEFFKPGIPFTQFIPVGMGLDYEFEMLNAKLKQYNLPAISSHDLYYRRPRFDMRSIVILLNDGRFNGAKLENFAPVKGDGGLVKGWYEKKDFRKIEHYLRDEAEGFLKLLQYLNKHKDLMGVTNKGGSAFERPVQKQAPSGSKKGYNAPEKSAPSPKKGYVVPEKSSTPSSKKGYVVPEKSGPSNSKKGYVVPERSSAGPSVRKETRGPRKNAGTMAKAKSPLKAPETPTSKRLSGAVSQFRKHTPASKRK